MKRLFWFGLVIIVLGVVYIGLGAKCPLDKKNGSGSSTPVEQHIFWTPTTLENAPPPRADHSAVWTGSKMIIWGGSVTMPFDCGGIYEPISDTWTIPTALNAPEGRNDQTAIWTGNKMIVWGGWNNWETLLFFNTGTAYDPILDTWTSITTTGAPISRADHTAIWSGTKMIIWGGASATSWYPQPIPFDTGAAYDPILDTWTSITTTGAPISRMNHTAIWTGSKMIVWGGMASGPKYLNTGAAYDPILDTWTPITTTGAPTSRTDHTAVWTGSKMIIWGGSSLNTGGIYDPETDTWTPITTINCPTAREYHTAIWTGSPSTGTGKMIIWGGGKWDPSIIYFNTGGIYDPQTDTWSDISIINTPSGRWWHTAVWTGTEMIIWGGTLSPAINTGARYKP